MLFAVRGYFWCNFCVLVRFGIWFRFGVAVCLSALGEFAGVYGFLGFGVILGLLFCLCGLVWWFGCAAGCWCVCLFLVVVYCLLVVVSVLWFECDDGRFILI